MSSIFGQFTGVSNSNGISIIIGLLTFFWLVVLGVTMIVMALTNKKNFIPAIPLGALCGISAITYLINFISAINYINSDFVIFLSYVLSALTSGATALSYLLCAGIVIATTVKSLREKLPAAVIKYAWLAPAILYLLGVVVNIVRIFIVNIYFSMIYAYQLSLASIIINVIITAINAVPVILALFFAARWAVIDDTPAPNYNAINNALGNTEEDAPADDATEQTADSATNEYAPTEATVEASPVTPEAVDESLSIAEQLRRYRAMCDEGKMTPEEFDAKRRQLLNLR